MVNRLLFTPIKIGSVEIKNRVVMAPMGILGLVNADGSLGPRALDYYMERAKGGVGLIVSNVHKVENNVEKLVESFPKVTRSSLAPLAELTESVHAFGCKIFVQLTAGRGRVGHRPQLISHPVSSSSLPNYWTPEETCKELTYEEVEALVRAFGDAAVILAQAGIDGIELHGHEGYLFDQFTTSLWNRRTDKYGGDLTARLRFPIEVLKEIKQRVGNQFPVQYRYGLKHYIKGFNDAALPGEEFTEAGRDIQEGLEMAKLLEKAGFDALHVDAGCYDSWYWAHPPGYHKHGCLIDMASMVKQVVNIPVIAVGRLEKPEIAEQVIAEEKADMVAIARGLLAEPYWVQKVERNQVERIRPCLGCHNGCIGRMFNGRPLSCAVNPATGRERSYALQPVLKPKRVMIVGGGIAGLEAARVASLRGHNVTLYEKNSSLGGHLLEASVPIFKEDEGRLLEWYKTELGALQVEVNLNKELTADFIAEKNPDVVIAATGSKPINLELPGFTRENVVQATEILMGKKQVGENVVVIGGGLIGCETAFWLAQQGKKVTIVEMLDDLMKQGLMVPEMNKKMLVDLLRYNQVQILTNSSVLSAVDEGVVVIDQSFRQKTIYANTIVVAVGMKGDQELFKKLKDKNIFNAYLIGDANCARNIMSAIWEAYEVASVI
ncbi:MAG: 2-enoate reductase [Clostridiaceae bacterium BRH_c20a]|nr:MAG: 2-enoate reductase [Clostridiaceae bacterium BRH_c20a]